MLSLLDPNEAVPWYHPNDLDENGNPVDGATIFHIKPLTELASRKIKAAHPTRVAGGEVILNTEAIMSDLFLAQVTKVENIKMPKSGQPTTLEGREGMLTFLNGFPPELMAPIYAAIQNTAALRSGESKNSDGSSGSRP